MYSERASRLPVTVGTLTKGAGVLFFCVLVFFSIKSHNSITLVQDEVSSLGLVYDKVKSSEESLDSRLNAVESAIAKDKKLMEEVRVTT